MNLCRGDIDIRVSSPQQSCVKSFTCIFLRQKFSVFCSVLMRGILIDCFEYLGTMLTKKRRKFKNCVLELFDLELCMPVENLLSIKIKIEIK